MLQILPFFSAPLQRAYERQYSTIIRARTRDITVRWMKKLPPELSEVEWTLVKELIQKPGHVYMLGMLHRDLPEYSWVLDEYDPDKVAKLAERMAPKSSYLSNRDTLFLEEPGGVRVRLRGTASGADLDRLPTGTIVAIKGHFWPAEDVLVVSGVWTPRPLPNPLVNDSNSLQGPLRVLFLSGLNMSGHPTEEERQALFSVLQYLHDPETPVNLLVVAGGLWILEDNDARRHFDSFMNHAAKHTQVLLIPGENDATNLLWPQDPLRTFHLSHTRTEHVVKRMGIKAEETDASDVNVCLVSNPAAFDFAGTSFLGTSGFNVKSILQTTKGLTPLEAMEGMLHWQHLCPTAPTYLPVAPTERKCENETRSVDPFVLEFTPHVFFCGGQEKVEARVFSYHDTSCLLLCIPEFSKTRQGLLFDMRTEAVECLGW